MKQLNLTKTFHVLPWGIIKPLGLITLAVAIIAVVAVGTFAWIRLRREPRP
jgi:hypothetical protein